MMSTISGLILGMLIAALVTVMYGQELSARAREAIDSQPAIKALLEQAPAIADPVAPESAVVPEVPAEVAREPMPANFPGESGPTSTADPRDEPGVDQAAQSGQIPPLEKRWLEYARHADELEPVGSYPWQQCFQRSAVSYDLPLALLLAIARGESNFDPAAVSDKNAIGLMQIRWPDTGHHLGLRRQADLYDPCTNVDAGARYLRELSRQYEDNLHLVVAAYNYGPGRISSGRVPEGAQWYSHYIYQHLQQVLGQEPSATSELIGVPADPGAGREVLMTFNRPQRARDFIAFLGAQVPGLNLQQQSESLGRHDVVLLYADQAERRSALQAMREAGLEALASRSRSTFQL